MERTMNNYFHEPPEAFIFQNPKDEDYEVLAGHNKKDGYNSHGFKYCPCCGKLQCPDMREVETPQTDRR